MSRFIKYASNLLDGVDNIAKDSLTDQDLAAAAAERRRRRKQLKRGRSSRQHGSGGVGSAAERSEGDLSADSSQLDTPGARVRDTRTYSGPGSGSGAPYGRGSTPLQYVGSFDDGGGISDGDHGGRGGGGGPSWKDGEGTQEQLPTPQSLDAGTSPGFSPGLQSRISATAAAAAAVTPTPKLEAVPGRAAAEKGAGLSAAALHPCTGEEDGAPAAMTAVATAAAAPIAAGGPVSTSPRQQQQQPKHALRRYMHTSPGMVAGGGWARGKEDGSVWSDKGTIYSAAPSPLGRGQGHDGDDHHDNPDIAHNTAPTQRRPPPLESSLIGGNEGAREEGEEEEERQARAGSVMASNASMHVNISLSPATTPLGRHNQQQQHRRMGDGFIDDDGGGSEHGAAASAVRPSSFAPSPSGARSSSTAVGGSGGGIGGERRGLGGLLRMGGSKGRRGNENAALEELKAEAEALRAEVEELSLELEDAEDRLRGQKEELETGAENLRRQRAAAAEREREMEAEMEDFRAQHLEDKKVFLANLDEMERKLKGKERDADEARSALSALEAFAMEREDAATRLAQEKKELLEELLGARSGQDRSAEEMREALTRAEAEAEEVETRHRTWMRQAQARQTELEATAAQLAEALAEANRKKSQPGAEETGEQGARSGGVAQAGGGTRAMDRELRSLKDELESCQASLELEQERTRSLQQEVGLLKHDLDAARATEAVVERQRQEHAKMAADSFAKASRLEQQLQQERASAKRLEASVPTPAGPEAQIQALSSKLLDKQARLEESARERTTLSAKLREASDRAFRAEQELRESRGETLETGGGGGGGGGVEGGGVGAMRSRRGRSGHGRGSPTGTWSRLGPIAKHKKIATAVDVLDRQTLQAVVFLRNSSVARAVFLAYLLLLHLWAFAVVSLHSSSTLNHIKHPAEHSGNANHGH